MKLKNMWKWLLKAMSAGLAYLHILNQSWRKKKSIINELYYAISSFIVELRHKVSFNG